MTVDHASGLFVTQYETATVADAALSATGVTAGGATAVAWSGTVAQVTDANSASAGADLSARIDWGDGSQSSGAISGSGGSFAVSGGHTYTAVGTYTVKVTVNDVGGATTTATSTVVVS